MKIGVMLRNWGERGGIGVYTSNILKSLFKVDQHNHYILIFNSPRHLGVFSGLPNVTQTVIQAPNKLWWDQISVPRLVKKLGLDLIYNPKLSVPLFAKCRKVLVMHGAEQFAIPHAFKWHDRIYFTIANRLYCKTASAIITPTRTGAHDIVNYMGADRRKVHVIYDAYNERCRLLENGDKEIVKKKYSLPDKFILHVGGLTPLKNIGNLLRAYKITSSFTDHRLVFVGFRRWKSAQDLALIDELGLREKVVFPGYIPDEELPAFYNLADAFVFPSLYEGFGIPVLEAMACGCPVITSNTGCSPEVAGGAALLVNPYKPDEIAAAMRQVLTDEGLRRHLIEKGYQRIKDFSWEKSASETLALFESFNTGLLTYPCVERSSLPM